MPAVSRMRVVNTVSPEEKVNASLTSMQNWTVELGFPKTKLAALSCVHAKSVDEKTLKRQPKSLSASLILCVGLKSGGVIAGTPPAVGNELSHTALLPFPRLLLLSIWRSGRPIGLSARELKTLVPTGKRLTPGRASTKMMKSAPADL